MEYIEVWAKIILFCIATFLIGSFMVYFIVLMVRDIIINVKKIIKEIKEKKNESIK